MNILNNMHIKIFAFKNVSTLIQGFIKTQYNLYKKNSCCFIIYIFLHILKDTKHFCGKRWNPICFDIAYWTI
jgi:hypothetical protein